MPALRLPSAPLHTVLAALTAPVFALKQIISILQMVTAAKRIVANDQRERAAAAVNISVPHRQTSVLVVPPSSPTAASPAGAKVGRGRSKSPAAPKSTGRKRA